jgi:hypothetical protein
LIAIIEALCLLVNLEALPLLGVVLPLLGVAEEVVVELLLLKVLMRSGVVGT